MNPYRKLLANRRVLAEQGAGYAVTGAAFYWWLGLEESSTARLALSLVTFLAIAAALFWLVRRARASLAGGATNAERLAALAGLLIATGAAYALVWWVPPVGPFATQAISAATRFLLAYLLLLCAWLAFLGATARQPTPAPEPQPSPANQP